jgi:hypothetical protein
MKVHALLVALVATTLNCLLAPAEAQQPTRVFVSGSGADGNSCGTTAKPCRNFQQAHNMVAPNGEIDVLDPAGYGTLIITKAISIQGYGIAGITGTSSNGITINAGPSDQINLNGLLIDGAGSGNTGILFNSGNSLNIQQTTIRNFCCGSGNIAPGSGILFSPQALGNSLFVSDTIVSDNGGYGILVDTSGSGKVTVDLDRVQLET